MRKKFTNVKATSEVPIQLTVGVPPIKPGTLKFTYNGVGYRDNGFGQLRLHSGRKPLGTVNYESGEITLNEQRVTIHHDYVPVHLRKKKT